MAAKYPLHSGLLAIAAAAGMLIPAPALHAASGDTIIEGTGTIEILQEAEEENALGNWTLIRPDRSMLSMQRAKRYINQEVPSGLYTLLIENAQGASAYVQLFRNGQLLSTSGIPRVAFTLSKDDVYLIRATESFTVTGKVSVTSQPAGIPFQLVGPNNFATQGVTPGSYEDVPFGLYSVQYQPPEGCPQPKAQSGTMEKDGRISFTVKLECDALSSLAQQEEERQIRYVTVTVGTDRIVLEDVPMAEWFATHIYNVAKTGIMSGYKDEAGAYTGQFGPGDSVSLAQLLKVAHKIAGISDAGLPSSPRNERAQGTWFQQYYASAEQRYWQVILDPETDPARPATRAEVITTLLQALDVPRIWPKGTLFRDVLPNAPYAASIETAALDGIVSSETNAFRPNDPINRAELAKIVTLAKETYLENSPEFTGDSY
ncbi:MAG: S-layer homology domain-containing protein [Candidatus Peribacteraceae bacterium]|nr:S-layer homology domain-containing protein [Candidatus Peribacteraceae bacterium]